MIAIVDYGLGNVRAFANVYHRLNICARVVKRADELRHAGKVILPGVGAFDEAIQLLDKSGMRQSLDEMVLDDHVPVLGVCVGMQMLALCSEEGRLSGLGWIRGEVKRFRPSSPDRPVNVPHMGWNTVTPRRVGGLFQGCDRDARFYFLHSYYFECHSREDILGVTEYCGEFVSAVKSGNVFGVQFHPEKSHQWGSRLLENFARL
jgi:glutamine amidotransferase